ncbi:hypothetical protein L198_07159 [Cryptococcus wingfieldii CBS 7118]|uniref:Uncharacterized protein n=1 Tax=Cryptococcus wingfieldii CBS 7118 TaxID=1295528 RepID=A0A1E3IDX7_9TREE|nr:hypothetical protein L198_07159 [Cryptococcus wingfieldii CBS 7118]ODN86797.1 hypothetical protein L198_07159 [Cryptococcus wingfieldii CBS 7118]
MQLRVPPKFHLLSSQSLLAVVLHLIPRIHLYSPTPTSPSPLASGPSSAPPPCWPPLPGFPSLSLLPPLLLVSASPPALSAKPDQRHTRFEVNESGIGYTQDRIELRSKTFCFKGAEKRVGCLYFLRRVSTLLGQKDGSRFRRRPWPKAFVRTPSGGALPVSFHSLGALPDTAILTCGFGLECTSFEKSQGAVVSDSIGQILHGGGGIRTQDYRGR